MRIRRPCRCLGAALAIVLWLALAGPASAQLLYRFAHLSGGHLAGQDGWTRWSASDAGYTRVGGRWDMSSSEFVASADGPQDAYARNVRLINSTPFSGQETSAILQFDTYALGSWAFFGLGHKDGVNLPPSEEYEIGPLFGWYCTEGVLNDLHFYLEAAGMGAEAISAATLQPTHWYSLQLRLDFTAYGGAGAGSLYYKDLTLGQTAFSAVPDLQNIELGLAAGPAASTWDAYYLGLNNWGWDRPQADNLLVNAVPEPAATAFLTALALAGLCAWRRRMAVHHHHHHRLRAARASV